VALTDEQLTREILIAASAVHNTLGPGFVESIYNKALRLEIRDRNLLAEREKMIRIVYNGSVIGRHYLDLVIENRAILELKATRAIIPLFEAQVNSNLSATDYDFGLIVNFGNVRLEWKQVNLKTK